MKGEGWQDETWHMVIGKMTDDKRRHDRWRKERWQMKRWKMTDGKMRHDIFPEDDILDIITISRYNYYK